MVPIQMLEVVETGAITGGFYSQVCGGDKTARISHVASYSGSEGVGIYMVSSISEIPHVIYIIVNSFSFGIMSSESKVMYLQWSITSNLDQPAMKRG